MCFQPLFLRLRKAALEQSAVPPSGHTSAVWNAWRRPSQESVMFGFSDPASGSVPFVLNRCKMI